MPSIVQFVVWIIVGLLAGSAVGLMIKGERKGFGATAGAEHQLAAGCQNRGKSLSALPI
jgi:hypothetical protein